MSDTISIDVPGRGTYTGSQRDVQHYLDNGHERRSVVRDTPGGLDCETGRMTQLQMAAVAAEVCPLDWDGDDPMPAWWLDAPTTGWPEEVRARIAERKQKRGAQRG